jgi:hypothetical protein
VGVDPTGIGGRGLGDLIPEPRHPSPALGIPPTHLKEAQAMKKYVLKFTMSETTLPKVEALWAALKAAEQEDIELVEFKPRPAKVPEIGSDANA